MYCKLHLILALLIPHVVHLHSYPYIIHPATFLPPIIRLIPTTFRYQTSPDPLLSRGLGPTKTLATRPIQSSSCSVGSSACYLPSLASSSDSPSSPLASSSSLLQWSTACKSNFPAAANVHTLEQRSIACSESRSSTGSSCEKKSTKHPSSLTRPDDEQPNSDVEEEADVTISSSFYVENRQSEHGSQSHDVRPMDEEEIEAKKLEVQSQGTNAQIRRQNRESEEDVDLSDDFESVEADGSSDPGSQYLSSESCRIAAQDLARAVCTLFSLLSLIFVTECKYIYTYRLPRTLMKF
ncbi:unnamed protein product [Protopolystoma xenopodis]|uniref:CTNNB1 binding N-teminal domain-containing protein n=1 Tax=Protopolystoma xenopodis TaxID=117903 RepID=A0A3S5BBF0_9PLAT|nr:unnamed protein product [Protopolystoma xenopodis]